MSSYEEIVVHETEGQVLPKCTRCGHFACSHCGDFCDGCGEDDGACAEELLCVYDGSPMPLNYKDECAKAFAKGWKGRYEETLGDGRVQFINRVAKA